MVYMYHSFLIHSFADGHLGCFHVLAMINSAAMNIGLHVSLSDLVSLVYHLEFWGDTSIHSLAPMNCLTESENMHILKWLSISPRPITQKHFKTMLTCEHLKIMLSFIFLKWKLTAVQNSKQVALFNPALKCEHFLKIWFSTSAAVYHCLPGH